MAMIKCSECGHDISDRAISCPHCGAPAANVFQNQQFQQNPNNFVAQQENITCKRKDSMLSIIACVLAGVSMIFPLPIFLSLIMIVASLVIGVIDLCAKDPAQRHIGSWFAIIISALYLFIVFV